MNQALLLAPDESRRLTHRALAIDDATDLCADIGNEVRQLGPSPRRCRRQQLEHGDRLTPDRQRDDNGALETELLDDLTLRRVETKQGSLIADPDRLSVGVHAPRYPFASRQAPRRTATKSAEPVALEVSDDRRQRTGFPIGRQIDGTDLPFLGGTDAPEDAVQGIVPVGRITDGACDVMEKQQMTGAIADVLFERLVQQT